ncbi:hypothetical protein OMO38_02560 [Chryseobacterium sp. 09-1422]|uniref:Uncharacterized protein n=1 Tax=Chryseobacterium kimseyorum TaxID=2984028 RepID=A0ABT3HUD2_9FLAO|nr:hypothetical protein [Chryseobacterium kimseyorum]MCW3167400.1 hypothetical protein [Chryseobacterium kimseyorum]
MKSFLFLLAFFVQTVVSAQIISVEDSIKNQREIDYKQLRANIMKVSAESCTRDSIRAVNDFKITNKLYISTPGPGGSDFPATQELGKLLQKQNIYYGGTWSGNCFGTYSTGECYYIYSTKLTEEKFGKAAIDKILKQAIFERIQKNPIIIFEYNDHTEWLHEGEKTVADSLLNNLFFKKFKYPKDYKEKKQSGQSFTEATVTVDFEQDKLNLVIEKFSHHFTDKENEKFIPQFEKQITDFINSGNFIFQNQHSINEGFKRSFKIYYK